MAEQSNQSPVESTQSTRQPTPLAVLLASAGTPPLDPEQARLAPIRLYDAFVLAPERARLFFGDARSLFARGEVVDPRHDALARVVRALAANLRQRLENYEASGSGRDLLRGVAALAAPRIEGVLTGFDLRRATSAAYTADVMLGSCEPEIDPLEAPDAGVLRRFLALAARGLMVERAARSGVVTDLGAVTLALALLDLVANPRSALRAARARLAKQGRLGESDTARVREVGQALRELLHHAISSATTTGATGRDLVREATLPPELMDHLAVALARAVYDGLGPDEEHPLVVPGAGAADALTFAPILVPDDEPAAGATLGLYNRIAFPPLPYARALPPDPSAGEPPRPPRAPTLDEGAFARAREALRSGTGAARAAAASAVFDTAIDPADARHAWRRAAPGAVPSQIARAVEQDPPATHVVLLVGPRGALAREVLQAFASGLAAQGRWHVLTPRATDRTMSLERLEARPDAGLVLRRADVSRWLDAEGTRAVEWTIDPGQAVVINAAAMEGPVEAQAETLVALARDVADKTDPRAVLVLVGAPSYAAAAAVLAVLSRHPELEAGEVPLRASTVWLVRTDAPVYARVPSGRAADEATLAALAEAFAPNSSLADHAARAALLPPEVKYRARGARLAAVAAGASGAFAEARRAAERAAAEPWAGTAMRRALQAGVASLASSRAALSAGLASELLGCMRHEVALLLAEYDGTRPRPHAARLADLARGQLLELVFAAHGRAAVLANDALLAVAAGSDAVERVAMMDGHAMALGARAGGTVYAREESRGVVPLGFLLRGGGADLLALVDVSVGAMPVRPVPAPAVELSWRPPAEREATLGSVAALLAALHDVVRRWGPDVPGRPATRDGRSGYAALVDVSVDVRLLPEATRIYLPLRSGASDGDAQRVAAEVVARLADAVGAQPLVEWTAQVGLEGARSPTPIALAGPLAARELVTRWQRGLRILPRNFPAAGSNPRYAPAPGVTTAAELGIASAVLAERRLAPTSPEGRALLSRLAGAASEVMPRVRELSSSLPVAPSFQTGSDWEVLERCLAVCWFLHANFCTSAPGPLQWALPDAPGMRVLIEQHLDRGALKPWLQRKTSRPEAVKQRIAAVLDALEPSIVVED